MPHIIPIIVPENLRDILVDSLRKNGIQAGVHYYPNHFLTKYKTDYSLPNTESLYKKILTLPIHPDLKDDDVKYIVGTLIETIKRAGIE